MAGLDPTLGDVWRAHEVNGQTYKEVALARSLTREQVRQRWAKRYAKAARSLGAERCVGDATLYHWGDLCTLRLLFPEWWSVKRAARKTGYSAYHLRHLIKEERVEAVRVGGQWRIQRESMVEYVAGRGDSEVE